MELLATSFGFFFVALALISFTFAVAYFCWVGIRQTRIEIHLGQHAIRKSEVDSVLDEILQR
jgi:hypothetical protein